ncbi:cytidylate kinase [Sphaerochaeta pleomorpha str. Grapes]|uniref:Cytidylate kinase n=1 Tax=Sphaerochaeta pleomorpha (strain ATCC BAA-1885 / DSM 22778 / Grapes) TaxID=158190 RepID=G8QR39_SPHPG|nr:AAA family ATPase [Sphaerochaeta pleomorpha]AEV30974.1 cytidylate kinase [Sphaerochaeta pleomorpha str. Grapes]
MRIAISGKSGCGNTTVSTLVSQALDYPLINFTFRNLANEKHMDFWDFCKLAEQSDEYDKELDTRQVEMAMAQKDCVLGSRLAIWMLEQADLKVYLTASAQERASRVYKREGGSFEERLAQTMMRDKNDSARYQRIYGIDNSDTAFADLVIDTSDKDPIQVAKIIIAEVKKRLA